MRNLTARQTAILEFIAAERQHRGRSPSYREIGQHFDIALNAVKSHLRALEKKGRLSRDGRKPRTIAPIDLVTDTRRQPRRVPAYEIFYPWLGMRNNVVNFTGNKDEARRILGSIEEDEHRGQDDREVRELELQFPGGNRFCVGYVTAATPGNRISSNKVWRPFKVLEVPPASILVDNVSYERSHAGTGAAPLMTSRATAIAGAAKENAGSLQVLDSSWPDRLHWAVIVEVGNPVRKFSMVELCGSLGRLEVTTHCPVRIVHPTPAEIAGLAEHRRPERAVPA